MIIGRDYVLFAAECRRNERETRAYRVPVFVGNRGDIARALAPGHYRSLVEASSDKRLWEIFPELNTAPPEGALGPEVHRVVSIQQVIGKLATIIDDLSAEGRRAGNCCRSLRSPIIY